MGASCHACIGGTNVRNEMQKLQAEAPHIVVGTPGRVFDMLNRRFLCKSSSRRLLNKQNSLLDSSMKWWYTIFRDWRVMEMLLNFTDHISLQEWLIYKISSFAVMSELFFWYVFVYVAPKWIKMFVLDEADEMLSRGFKDQIYEIFQKLSTNIQVSLCLSSRDKKSCGGARHKVHSCLVLVRRFGVPLFPPVFLPSFHPKELCLNYRLQVSWFM